MTTSDFKNQNNLFGLIFFFFLLLFLYTKFVGPFPFSVTSVQTNKQTSFMVTGEGKATAVPNQATISFGVTKQAATVADAQDQTNKAVETALNSIKSQGIDIKDIKTTNYSVNPQYDYKAATQTISGYQVSQNVDLKVKQLDKVNKVLDALTANGANVVNQVSFGFDDATQKKLNDQARTEAVKEAKEKAQSMASIAGFHLGRIVDVQENLGGGTPMPVMFSARKEATGMGAADIAQSNVTPGQNEVSLSVTLSYETY
jgi:uncharacterized protein YggE